MEAGAKPLSELTMGAKSPYDAQLIFKALCVLDQAIDDCNAGPVVGTFGLRFALAFLYAASDGNRHHFDKFWQITRDPMIHAYSEDSRAYQRTSYARTSLTGICDSIGLPLTLELGTKLSEARRVLAAPNS